MEVGEPTPLQLNNFHERNPCSSWVFCTDSQLLAQQSAQPNREPPPELWCVPRKQHVPQVVIALATQRLPEFWVVVAVRRLTRHACLVLAAATVGVSWLATAA